METTTTLTIRIIASFAKQTAVFEDYIQQAENEPDSDFLKRAAVVLNVLRLKSR